jgi:hypothetical protein
MFCDHVEVENYITIYNDRLYERRQRTIKEEPPDQYDFSKLTELEKVRISLLDKSGNLPPISGLNWGQRPGREPNQAYIRVPSTIYNTSFFPPIATHFTVLTDDNKVLICTTAQANGKAIETPHNNSLIGEYFRRRLNLPSGSLVTKEDLIKYGRADIVFFKLDDETYYLDFSV